MDCFSVLPQMLKRLGKVEAGPERRRLPLHPRRKKIAQFLPPRHLLKSLADPCSGSLLLRGGVEFLREDGKRFVPLTLFSVEHAKVVAQVRQFRMRME